MRYLHQIETTTSAQDPNWQTIRSADAEDYDGTAAEYGREVLAQWIDDNPDDATTDDDGNPTLRVIIAFADGEDAFASDANRAAVIEADGLEAPAPEIAAVEAARERKFYVALLDAQADDALTNALAAARAAGHGANRLAERAAPAVSRPVALRMMSPARVAEHYQVGALVTVPPHSVPDDWARDGEIIELTDETAIVGLTDGHRQELPRDELTPRR